MIVDAHFERGRGHAVCQDYALCGAGSRGAWAVVCDGCSSSPQTDVGARLLAHAAATTLRDGRLPGSIAVVREATMMAGRLALPPCSVDVTVVAALEHHDAVVAMIRGDGIVAARRHGGDVELVVRRCRDEAPDYPSVVLDPERRAVWCDRPSPRAWIEHSCDGDTAMHVEVARGHAWVGVFPKHRYDRVLVASDGLASLREGDGEPLPAPWVARRMLDVPSTTGCFVRRRMVRLGQRGGPFGAALPEDDLAVAVLGWGDE